MMIYEHKCSPAARVAHFAEGKRKPMPAYALMNSDRCSQWVSLCIQKAATAAHMLGVALPGARPYDNEESIACVGLLTQWACEDNESFQAAFSAIARKQSFLNPFHPNGLSFIDNLVHNGIMDDWEIFAHWGPGGYVIVPEAQRKDADRRLDFAWAPGWLYRRVGGVRTPDQLDEQTVNVLEVGCIDICYAEMAAAKEATRPSVHG